MTETDKSNSITLQCIDAIEVSLCIEKEGLYYYERAAKQARDQRVRNMFARLAQEEKEHILSLQEKARFLQPALSRKATSRRHVEEFIASELKGKVFPEFKKSDANVSNAQSDLEALEVGIASEKKSIEVLSRLMREEKKIDVRAIFSHLLAEEKKHLEALETLKKSYLSQTA